LSAVVESTIFSPADAAVSNNRRMKADENDQSSLDSCSNTHSYAEVQYGDGNIYLETYGLYNECKCNILMRQCENTREEIDCEQAAEFCCGDYGSPVTVSDNETFYFLNSPLCYCDFYNYIYANDDMFSRCDQPQNIWQSVTEEEKKSLTTIYDETNGQGWTNNNGWKTELDHCQWYGISCDDEGFVTSIDLKDNNLEGKFPVYTNVSGDSSYDNEWEFNKYGLANLYKLKALDLSNNTLTGTIEYLPLYNLPSLTYFNVSKNQLTGEIDALVAPSLTHVDFSNNNFKSMRRFEKYKDSSFQSLRFCDVSNNAIQNDVADILESIPPNIEQFIASNNHINGTLPDSLNHLQKLRQFKMASNELSGELPGFADSLPTLYKLDVSTNGLTGPIPENIWRSLSLATLNLTGNLLTGTIPSTVGNLAVLEEFDLSNNTLSGSIPSELGQIRGASVFLKGNGFYSNITAPLSLCVKREVKEFDLAENATFCPIERNALSDLYDSAKGAEWTDQGNKTNGTLWLDEYESYCNWKGVTCDDNHVIELNLTNNGLSGRLSESIGKLIFVTLLDLSDNDIKVSDVYLLNS
jgi:Leucine-rich repeat (LRR) protein